MCIAYALPADTAYGVQVAKIVAHGCSVFINRQLIYNLPESVSLMCSPRGATQRAGHALTQRAHSIRGVPVVVVSFRPAALCGGGRDGDRAR
jgi:hypothetical protein